MMHIDLGYRTVHGNVIPIQLGLKISDTIIGSV
jgi:hypothetical protein